MSQSVLVIDDSEIVLSATRAMLEEGGYQVSTHRRATGSVGLILQTKPDLVLLDVNMPHLRGDMVARMSLATNQSTRTVVVLHSTLSDQELQRLKDESGAHGYIRKTNDTPAFLRSVRSYLGDSSRGHVVRKQTTRPPRAMRQELKNESLLLVDQDVTALSALSKQVQELGYMPLFALSLKQASDKIKAQEPDVLVINSALGETDEFITTLPAGLAERSVLLLNGDEHAPRGFAGQRLYRPVQGQALQLAIASALERRVSV